MDKVEIVPIGVVRRESPEEDVLNRNLVSKIVLERDLAKALDGIEGFSCVFVMFWMHEISDSKKRSVVPVDNPELPPVGVFVTRVPIRPNPIGLSLVELVKREKNVL